MHTMTFTYGDQTATYSCQL